MQEDEVLVQLKSSGICGSDIHIWKGNDPRTPLPLIPGHEGVGIIADIKGEKTDVFGKELKQGDFIIWDRGITCGRCYFCMTKNKPYLCQSRKTYGISLSCSTPPYLSGCYSEYIHLRRETKIIKIEEKIAPAILVPASCSGATIAHSFELCKIEPGDTVVVQGPGPTGIFAVVFAIEAGAKQVIVTGTERSMDRLKLCTEFGATDILVVDKTSIQERVEIVISKTKRVGADVVIECTGSLRALEEGIQMVSPGGSYILPGIATPVGKFEINVYEELSRKNVSIHGSWVSDVTHLSKAVNLILSKKYPFEKLITHKFELDKVNQALDTVDKRKALKTVFVM